MFKRRRRKASFGFRFVRSLFAVVVLSALVLSISLFAKKAYDLDSIKFANLTSPLAHRLGISESKAGEVAGDFVARISKTGVIKDSGTQDLPSIVKENESTSLVNSGTKEPVLTVALMADSEDANENLRSALQKASKLNAEYLFFLGDLTAYGDIDSLKQAKKVLDEGGIKYSAIPGDHDIADSNNKQNGGYGLENFREVFGQTYQLVVLDGFAFLLMDNSPNRTALDETRFTWFLNNVTNADFVLLSQPIYHPSPTDLMGVMGLYQGQKVEGLHEQSLIMLSRIRTSRVKAVISADHHMSSTNYDQEKPELVHSVIGALSKDRNIQRPRFSLLTVYEDATFKIEDVTL